MIRPGWALKNAIESSELTYIASVCDAFTGKIAEAAGFDALMLGSALVQNSFLGMADAGFITLTEMEMVVARTAEACQVPVCVDAEAGYGNAINVIHATRSLERAGAAMVVYEDQENPPRGGWAKTPAVVSTAEMVGKIKAAVDARKDENFLVMVRTDTWRHDGLEGTIERGNAYAEAGADGYFVMGRLTRNEYEQVVDAVKNTIHLGILGISPDNLTATDYHALGFPALLSGQIPLRSSYLSLLENFVNVRENGSVPDLDSQIADSPMERWDKFTGFEWLREMESRYVAER